MPKKYLSIRNKLTLLLMTTSTLAVLVACSVFYVMVLSQFKLEYRASLENLITITGENCKVSLLFDVPEDATVILRSLQNRDSIISVHLYDKNDTLFAVYARDAQKHSIPPPQSLLFTSDSTPPLRIEKNIFMEDDSFIGRIILEDNQLGIAKTKETALFILTVVIIIAILISFFLAFFLRNIISRPLETLTTTAKRLAKEDYSAIDDIAVSSTDEIGTLSSAFIEMGHHLQTSRHELENHNRTLELRVTERTQQLLKTVSDLKQSQAQLVHSEKMAALGVLVAGVAHDINNNINFISSIIPSVGKLTKELLEYVEARPDAWSEDQNAQEIYQDILGLLESAEEGVRRTSSIVNDLSTFSHPCSGNFVLADIHAEIETILRFLQVELKERVTIVKEFAPEFPPILCLPDELAQVFTNILLNASHAIPNKGTITITTWLQDKIAHIRFRDTGAGIDEEVLPKIFDPFFTTKPVGKGTGLGLSISYSVLKNHHGDIQVRSQVGEGTDVVLFFPGAGGDL